MYETHDCPCVYNFSPILRSQDSDATDLEMKLGAERGQQLLQLCGSYMLRRCVGVILEIAFSIKNEYKGEVISHCI